MCDRIVETTWEANGRQVIGDQRAGTELSIAGERGRFRFVAYVLTDTAEWIDVFGGTDNQQAWRSFDPARVTRVHTKPKLRPGEFPKANASLGKIRP